MRQSTDHSCMLFVLPALVALSCGDASVDAIVRKTDAQVGSSGAGSSGAGKDARASDASSAGAGCRGAACSMPSPAESAVPCSTAADCPDFQPTCVGGRVCVGCSNDTECDRAAGEVCNLLLSRCLKPCASAADCGGEFPFCSSHSNACLECLRDSDCKDPGGLDIYCRAGGCVPKP